MYDFAFLVSSGLMLLVTYKILSQKKKEIMVFVETTTSSLRLSLLFIFIFFYLQDEQ